MWIISLTSGGIYYPEVPRRFVARARALQERADVIAALIDTLAPNAGADERKRLVEKVGRKAKKVEAAGRKPGESTSKTSAAGSSETALLRTLVGQQAT
ncbi:MAG: MAP kinase kinase (MEK), partial [Watsoniomyces obsoletus]